MPLDLRHLLVTERRVAEGSAAPLVLERIFVPLDLAVQQEPLGEVGMVVAQHEDDDRQFVERPPAGLRSCGVTGAERALDFGGDQACSRVQQSKR
jgi:hypothetical protein